MSRLSWHLQFWLNIQEMESVLIILSPAVLDKLSEYSSLTVILRKVSWLSWHFPFKLNHVYTESVMIILTLAVLDEFSKYG